MVVDLLQEQIKMVVMVALVEEQHMEALINMVVKVYQVKEMMVATLKATWELVVVVKVELVIPPQPLLLVE